MIELARKIFSWFRGLKWVPSWLRESNREKHFLLAIPAGYIGTLVFVLGIAVGLETKDVQKAGYDFSAWDWLDFAATILGGLIGQVLQLLTIILIIALL